MSAYPELVSEYIQYVNYKGDFERTGKIDLDDLQFVYPTTLLPLSEIILKNRDKYIPPKSYPVENYINTILDSTSSNFRHTYTPIVSLPENCEEIEEPLKTIFKMQRNLHDFGGVSAFKYVVSELVDNIYQHSRFTRALIMGQRYDNLGFIDLSFYDNGITIPQTFKEKGFNHEASFAIREALNGVSTKDNDRGFGLRTSLNLFKKGLNAEFFIVSGNGAVYCDGKVGDLLYRLTEDAGLKGTLITVRIPKTTPEVNIYDYVE
jgi:hypothetical protein